MNRKKARLVKPNPNPGPYRKRYRRHPKVPSRKEIFHVLTATLMSGNNGKILDYAWSAGNYFWHERNRKGGTPEGTTYYVVRARGNYLTATKLRYVTDDGKGLNTFVDIFVGSDRRETTLHKEILLKTKISDYIEFTKEYKRLTPDLGWFND